MDPSPVGIDDDLALLGCAASSGSALAPRHGRMGLGCVRADLLAVHTSGERGEDGNGFVHFGYGDGEWEGESLMPRKSGEAFIFLGFIMRFHLDSQL